MSVQSWLLDGDPAIRWQVMQDLMHEPATVVAKERLWVAHEGWGAQLLGQQTPGGYWGSKDEYAPWITTIYALVLLKDLGVDPSDPKVRTAMDLLRQQVTWWPLDGRPFFEGETEPCINGAILASGAYFGEDVEKLVQLLLGEQLEDGGWNCKAPASKRSSFHTTICVLEGLLQYEKSHGAGPAITQARLRAEEYLLDRRLMRSRSTGEILDRKWLRFAFPPVWGYDVLRALDHLRKAGRQPDARAAEAVEAVRERSHQNGRWPLNHQHPDRIAFDMEPGVGMASRWNTLRALRVLQWYEPETSREPAQAAPQPGTEGSGVESCG